MIITKDLKYKEALQLICDFDGEKWTYKGKEVLSFIYQSKSGHCDVQVVK